MNPAVSRTPTRTGDGAGKEDAEAWEVPSMSLMLRYAMWDYLEYALDPSRASSDPESAAARAAPLFAVPFACPAFDPPPDMPAGRSFPVYDLQEGRWSDQPVELEVCLWSQRPLPRPAGASAGRGPRGRPTAGRCAGWARERLLGRKTEAAAFASITHRPSSRSVDYRGPAAVAVMYALDGWREGSPDDGVSLVSIHNDSASCTAAGEMNDRGGDREGKGPLASGGGRRRIHLEGQLVVEHRGGSHYGALLNHNRTGFAPFTPDNAPTVEMIDYIWRDSYPE